MELTEWQTMQVLRCREKVPYLSEWCATNAAFLINLRNLGTGQEIQTPYRCPTCGDFHLTSRPTLSGNAGSTSTSDSTRRSLQATG